MKKLFESGEFRKYRKTFSLDEARGIIAESSQYPTRKTVFISHKHGELEDLKDIIGFLEVNYSVKCYIDSRDPTLPIITSGKTAARIKNRIRKCDKFILLATNMAIESKWCNWELGIGDGAKYPNSIALFPIKPKGSGDSEYKGSEYMELYPYISYYYGNESYTSGKKIKNDYYVRTNNLDGSNRIVSLGNWLLSSL